MKEIIGCVLLVIFILGYCYVVCEPITKEAERIKKNRKRLREMDEVLKRRANTHERTSPG